MTNLKSQPSFIYWAQTDKGYPPHTNRILIHKPHRIGFIIPEEVVVQPCLTVGILVLKLERMVCAIRYLGFLFQMTSISTNASIGIGIGLLKNGCFRDGLTGFVLGLDPTYLLWLA